MTILYINGAETAQILKDHTNEAMAEFDPLKPPKDLSSITLVAHTNDDATKIGNRTPEELATDFATMIPAKRKQLKHIYLLADEAGMSKHGQPSLAQQFVNKMADLGFTDLKVHAVASPGVPHFGMGVEVISNVNRRSPGFFNAFYYKNQESKAIDSAIRQLIEKIETNQKEIAAINSVQLTRESRAEKNALEVANRKAKTELQGAIAQRKRNLTYQRVPILSASDYKAAMNESGHSFKAYQTEPVMSAHVSYAIHYLSLQTKHTASVQEDLKTLKSNPTWNLQQITELLNKHKNERKGEAAHYYRSIVSPLIEQLAQQDFSLTEVAHPYEIEKPAKNPLQQHGFFAADPAPLIILSAREQLQNYKACREGEWGVFHYNFLGLMAMLYLISDYLSGTDYYNSKRREVKVSAVDKLLNNQELTENSFTVHEWKALHEGRLGKIIGALGGFDAVVAELNPKPSEAELPVDDIAQELAAFLQ